MIKNELIIASLKRYYDTTGKRPTKHTSTKELGVSRRTIIRKIGWSNALLAAGIPDLPTAIVKKKCAECLEDIYVKNSQTGINNFCSQSCSATFNNKNRKHSEETKGKISISVKEWFNTHPKSYCGGGRVVGRRSYELVCQVCDAMFISKNKNKQTCSTECNSQNISNKVSLWLKTHRSHIRGPHQQSYMEKSFEAWLNINNIHKGLSGYLSEVYFFNNFTKKNGWCDFLFPRKRIIVELDGKHHIKRKELDEIRDNYLNTRGWKVIRISQREYIKQTHMEYIKELLGIYNVPVV